MSTKIIFKSRSGEDEEAYSINATNLQEFETQFKIVRDHWVRKTGHLQNHISVRT